MGEVTIRRAGADDAFLVGALYLQHALDRGMARDDGYLSRFADQWLAERADRPTWIAERDGEHAGLLVTRRIRPLPWPGRPDRSWLYVGLLFVVPAHRKAGVGRALVEGMLEWSRHTDVFTIRLNAEPDAIAFYEGLGFSSDNRLMEFDLKGDS